MPTEKMSLTRALAETKILEDRITRAITNGIFLSLVQGKSETPVDRNYKDKNSLKSKIEADYNSITDLVSRARAIKAAISKANENTLVKVGDKEVTISQAIVLKNTLKFENHLLSVIKNQILTQTNVGASLLKQLEAKVETSVNQIYSNGQNKPTKEQYEVVRNNLHNEFEPQFFDPLDVKEKVRKLEDWLSNIALNLDFALSEVNAKTEIEVNY